MRVIISKVWSGSTSVCNQTLVLYIKYGSVDILYVYTVSIVKILFPEKDGSIQQYRSRSILLIYETRILSSASSSYYVDMDPISRKFINNN